MLREDVADWFELDRDSPYMLLVADIVEKRRQQMSAAEHGDCMLVKAAQDPALRHDYQGAFAAD